MHFSVYLQEQRYKSLSLSLSLSLPHHLQHGYFPPPPFFHSPLPFNRNKEELLEDVERFIALKFTWASELLL